MIIKRLSLCRYCQYINQILSDFFLLCITIFNVPYITIFCIFTTVYGILRMQYIRDLGNKMFLENSLQCQSFLMHNPAAVNVIVKIPSYMWKLVQRAGLISERSTENNIPKSNL